MGAGQWILVVYVIWSLLVGMYFELEMGRFWNTTARRLGHVLGYAAGWPLLAVLTFAFILAMDDQDPHW